MKRLIQSVGLAAASLLVTLILLELAVRAFVSPSRWLFLDAAADWRIDSTIGWTQQADLDVISQTPFGPVHFRTNADGLIPSGASRVKPPGTVRIMVFGDSMVVGRSVEQDHTYTARLEAALRARGIPAEVINAGVQGYSTDQALLLMQRWLPVYRPDIVLYGSTLNDYGGNTLASAYGQAKPRFRLDDRGALQLELPRVDSEIHPFGSGPRRWLQNSALYRLIQPGIALLRARLFGFEEGVLLGTEQGVYLKDGSADSLDWPIYEALVAQMRRSAEQAGARFVFFAHPEVGEVWEPYIETVCSKLGISRASYDAFAMEKRLRAFTAAQGIEFVPTIDAFRAAPHRGPFHLLPMDAHLNPAGHALLAELLTDRLAVDLAATAGAPSSLASGERSAGTIRPDSSSPRSQKDAQVGP